jgi:hypothetical protein
MIYRIFTSRQLIREISLLFFVGPQLSLDYLLQIKYVHTYIRKSKSRCVSNHKSRTACIYGEIFVRHSEGSSGESSMNISMYIGNIPASPTGYWKKICRLHERSTGGRFQYWILAGLWGPGYVHAYVCKHVCTYYTYIRTWKRRWEVRG